MKTDIIQKAIVLNAENKMLLLRRSADDDRRPLQWDIPGGLLEPNEEMIPGVEREITEESGLAVTGTRAIYTLTTLQKWPGGEANAVRIFFTAAASNDQVTLSEEHIEYQWVTLQEAYEIIAYDIQKQMIKYVIDNKLVL